MDQPPLPGSQPAARAKATRRSNSGSNWGLRLVAVVLSALAFLGLWQGAQLSSAQQTPAGTPRSGGYAPPSATQGGLLPPGGLGPHGSTHLS